MEEKLTAKRFFGCRNLCLQRDEEMPVQCAEERKKMLPNLICPGAPKAGTTTLYKILCRHPDVYFSHKKEIHYFNMHYSRGRTWYEKYFEGSGAFRYRCDFTAGYLANPDAPGRMRSEIGPDVKFIIMLRNPVDRAYSHFQMLRGMLLSDAGSLMEILEKDMTSLTGHERKLIETGFYSMHIKRYLDFFPIENIYFIIFEDFIEDMEGETKKLLEFLGLDTPAAMDLNAWANKSSMPKSMSHARIYYSLEKAIPVFLLDRIPAKAKIFVKKAMKNVLLKGTDAKIEKDIPTCKRLIELYEDDILETQSILGRDLEFWIKKYGNRRIR